MERSESIAAIGAALAKAQGSVTGASKDSINPHFKTRYADLASIWEACRAQLAANGIAVVQSPEADGAKVTVSTLLVHASGEWIQSTLSITAQQNTPQGVGSAITYARRYGLASMVGVAPEDDDSEAAETRPAGHSEPVHHEPAKETPAASPRSATPPYVSTLWKRCLTTYGDEAKARWDAASKAALGEKYPASAKWTAAQARDVEMSLFPDADIAF